MAIKTSKKPNGEKVIDAASKRTPFAVVESYKNLRTNLVSVLAKNDGKILAVTSPNAAEGKSTTSLNIAITLSQLNKNVVIVDTDSRKPSIHKKIKISNNKGCMDYLLGTHSLEEITVNYNPYLDVITSGAKVKNPSELFSDIKFMELLEKLEERYDYIVLDTPPINLVSDVLIIAQKCDAVVMVVRANSTKYQAFETAYDSLKVLDIELDGVIINGSGGKNSYYSGLHYQKSMREKYKSHNEQKKR